MEEHLRHLPPEGNAPAPDPEPVSVIDGRIVTGAEWEAHKAAIDAAIEAEGGPRLLVAAAGTDAWEDLTVKTTKGGVTRREMKSPSKVRAILRRILAPPPRPRAQARPRQVRRAPRRHAARLAASVGAGDPDPDPEPPSAGPARDRRRS